jgi:hypothetical protein
MFVVSLALACQQYSCLNLKLWSILSPCQTNNTCNQKCLVAICRAMWTMRASGSVQNMTLWQAFLKFLAKSGAKDNFKEEMLILKPLVDAALRTSYTNFKKEQVGAQAWWELFKDRCYSHSGQCYVIGLLRNIPGALLWKAAFCLSMFCRPSHLISLVHLPVCWKHG